MLKRYSNKSSTIEEKKSDVSTRRTIKKSVSSGSVRTKQEKSMFSEPNAADQMSTYFNDNESIDVEPFDQSITDRTAATTLSGNSNGKMSGVSQPVSTNWIKGIGRGTDRK